MWENEEHKNLVRNIIIFVVLVVVAAALLITMFAVRKRINAEDELLKAESDSQRQELNNVRKDNLDSVIDKIHVAIRSQRRQGFFVFV